jgi:cytochrome P450
MIRFSYSEHQYQAWKHASEDRAILAFNIIRECLRLYPSTKRIYRVFHLEGEPHPASVSANVEACHCDRAVWGDDADAFVPERWLSCDVDMVQAWMPFGAYPFLCPARKDFALRIIVVLVGGLCRKIIVDEWKVDLGADQWRLDEGMALPSGRFSARNWMLRRTDGDGAKHGAQKDHDDRLPSSDDLVI